MGSHCKEGHLHLFVSVSLRKSTFRFSLIFVSTSKRTTSGWFNPAFANSIRSYIGINHNIQNNQTFGIVALNRTVCLVLGNFAIISFNCSPNPISNNRSASSKTTYSTDDKLISVSFNTCKNLPGVAIILHSQHSQSIQLTYQDYLPNWKTVSALNHLLQQMCVSNHNQHPILL